MGTVKQHTETIDGIAYTSKTFTASPGIVLGARLGRLVPSQSWRELIAVEPDRLPDLLANPLIIVDGLIEAAKDNEPEELAALAHDLVVASETSCDNIAETGQPGPVKAHYETHFAGRLGHLMRVLAWIVRLNFVGP